VEENEELTTSYANSELSLHHGPITLAENTGNAHGPTLTEGENCLNVLNFSTNHAIIEQLLVEPSLDLSLSQDNLLDVPCDKDELVEYASVLHVLELVTCAKNKHVIHIATKIDEFKLLSSLHTLGYIEFDVLCNLDCLEESLFKYADLPWFSKHTYYVIGRYNNKGQYMIHRVYIHNNMNYPFVVQDYGRLEGSHNNTNIFSCSLKKQVHFQEGEHCWLLPMSARPSIPALSLVSSNLL
jgi:hypothetical protein